MKGFSWKKAILHALMPVGVIVVAGTVLVVLDLVADPERFGEGVGRFIFFVLLIGMGTSYYAQTGRKRAAWWLALGSFAAVGILVAVVLAGRA